MMKLFIKKIVLLLISVLTIASCAKVYVPSSPPEAVREQSVFAWDADSLDYSGLSFTPWDAEEAADAVGMQPERAYTLMIYMNGSDLESEDGAATADLLEIIDSGVDESLINVLIFTGGTYRWHNDAVPPYECALWRLEGGGIAKIAGLGALNMGDPGTLASFVGFGLRCFPAAKYGLIFWDHGGGSVAGYGYDEVWGGSGLSLLETAYALKMSGAGERKLEFIGFDACLMATVETAVVASNFAEYLIASEETEPSEGWDYHFLSALNSEPRMDGKAIGAVIADYYMEYYGGGEDDSLTMSVTELSRSGGVMGAMGTLMDACSSLIRCDSGSYVPRSAQAARMLAERRGETKTFGNFRDSGCDMVDIGDMAAKLSDIFPEEAKSVLSALDSAVVYNRHNSGTDLGGLTAFYISGGRRDAALLLKIYAGLKMSPEYTDYLTVFAGIGNDDTDLGNQLFELSRWRSGAKFGVPVRINGHDADLIIRVKGTDAEIAGVRRIEGYVIQKGEEIIRENDVVSILDHA